MSDRAPSDCLLCSWMLRNIHEQKLKYVEEENLESKELQCTIAEQICQAKTQTQTQELVVLIEQNI